MKAAKLIAALMPTLAVASNAAAQVSTTTVVNPVTTRTHTQIVFVTASAGPTVSTCLASFCGLNNASTSELSTIRLTSFTTATTTTVVTPPDTTVTIDHATDKNGSTSCVMRTPSTITVTVTETSVPVITKSVYPIPAPNEPNEAATHTPPYPSQSFISNTGSVLPSPPYLNASGIDASAGSTIASTGHLSYHTNVLGALPDNPASISQVLASSSPTVNKILGPFQNTEGMFNRTSSAGRLRPLQLFTLLTRFIVLVDSAKSQVTGAIPQQIESRFYSYPAPLNSGPPPHLSNTPRDISDSTITESQGLVTLMTTSTIVHTTTDVQSHNGPFNFSALSTTTSEVTIVQVSDPQGFPSATSDSSATTTSDSVDPVATVVSTTTVAPVYSSEINNTQPGSYSTWWSDVHNVTVEITVTETASPLLITTTTTVTNNVTNTIEKPVTHTTTKLTTTGLFNGGSSLTAAGVVEGINFFLGCITIATWIVLFAMT